MQVDVSHRSNLVEYKKSDYASLADRCVSNLRVLPSVTSIVVCGSLAKQDIVCGWSDIDVIVFLNGSPDETSPLTEIAHAIANAKENLSIGIGLDVVYSDQFNSTHKLCGRPYMMTYEVGAYGEVRYGVDYLSNIPYDAAAKALVNHERPLLIAAEMHSWRRHFMAKAKNHETAEFLFLTAKALLRILQCETGPNLVKPINTQSAYDKFTSQNPDHPACDAFKTAVRIRKDWSEYLHKNALGATVDRLCEAVNQYPLSLPLVNNCARYE